MRTVLVACLLCVLGTTAWGPVPISSDGSLGHLNPSNSVIFDSTHGWFWVDVPHLAAVGSTVPWLGPMMRRFGRAGRFVEIGGDLGSERSIPVFDFASVTIGPDVDVILFGESPMAILSQSNMTILSSIDVSGGSGRGPGAASGAGGGGVCLFADGDIEIGPEGEVVARGGDGHAGEDTGGDNGKGDKAGGGDGGKGGKAGENDGGDGGMGGSTGVTFVAMNARVVLRNGGGGGGGGGAYEGVGGASGQQNNHEGKGKDGAEGECAMIKTGGNGGKGGGGGGAGGTGGTGSEGGIGSDGIVQNSGGGGGGGAGAPNAGPGGSGGAGSAGGGGGGGGGTVCGGGQGAGQSSGGAGGGGRASGAIGTGGAYKKVCDVPSGGAGGGGAIVLAAGGEIVNLGVLDARGGVSGDTFGGDGVVLFYGNVTTQGAAFGVVNTVPDGFGVGEFRIAAGGGGGGPGSF